MAEGDGAAEGVYARVLEVEDLFAINNMSKGTKGRERGKGNCENEPSR